MNFPVVKPPQVNWADQPPDCSPSRCNYSLRAFWQTIQELYHSGIIDGLKVIDIEKTFIPFHQETEFCLLLSRSKRLKFWKPEDISSVIQKRFKTCKSRTHAANAPGGQL